MKIKQHLKYWPQTSTFVKYLLFSLNFVIYTLGVLLFSTALWIRSDSTFWVYNNMLSLGHFYWACYLALGACCLLALMTFFSWFGTLIDSKFYMGLQLISSLVTLALELTILILLFSRPLGNQQQVDLAQDIMQHIEQYDFQVKSRNFIDFIQLKLQCCGAQSFLDFKNRQMLVPQSCSNVVTNNINYQSCSQMLRRHLEIRIGIMAGLTLCLMVIQSITSAISIAFVSLSSRFKMNM